MFADKKQRQAWVAASVENMLTYGIDYNPQGAYATIKQLFPDFDNWGPGLAVIEANKRKMHAFLLDRAAKSKNATAFAVNFLQLVPFNQDGEDLYLIKAS